jgi:hypothetical protein
MVIRRRRRRWPWVMLMFTVLSLCCCCGVPAYFGKPMWQQYPASANIPDAIDDLTLRDDQASKKAADELKRELRGDNWLAEETFAAIYTDPRDKRVTVFGATGFRWSPEGNLDDEFTRLRSEYNIRDDAPIDTGVRGYHQRCGTGRNGDTSVVVCAWADHGSLGVIVFTRLSRQDSADRIDDIRDAIIIRG